MYYTYVLYSTIAKKFYIGYTTNLQRRFKEHVGGKSHTTYRFPDLNLIFYEYFISKQDAIRRERYFKTTKGKKALKLMLRESLNLIEVSAR